MTLIGLAIMLPHLEKTARPALLISYSIVACAAGLIDVGLIRFLWGLG